MSVLTTKVNGKIDSLQIWGKELPSFLNVIQILWNECEFIADNHCCEEGVEVLQSILREIK